MTPLKKIVAAAGFTLSFAGLVGLADPASAMPASPVAPATLQADAAPALEHVQYYGYGYPCAFPLRCGYYGPRYYGGYYRPGFYGRGFYGRGYYGRGYRR